MWILDRCDGNSKSASLHGRSRYIEDFEFALKWNKDTWQYEMDGELWLKQLKKKIEKKL
jgi:hypothetical protein